MRAGKAKRIVSTHRFTLAVDSAAANLAQTPQYRTQNRFWSLRCVDAKDDLLRVGFDQRQCLLVKQLESLLNDLLVGIIRPRVEHEPLLQSSYQDVRVTAIETENTTNRHPLREVVDLARAAWNAVDE